MTIKSEHLPLSIMGCLLPDNGHVLDSVKSRAVCKIQRPRESMRVWQHMSADRVHDKAADFTSQTRASCDTRMG